MQVSCPDAQHDGRDAGLPASSCPSIPLQHALQSAEHRLQELPFGSSQQSTQACKFDIQGCSLAPVLCIVTCDFWFCSEQAVVLATVVVGQPQIRLNRTKKPALAIRALRALLTCEDGVCTRSCAIQLDVSQGILEGSAGADLHTGWNVNLQTW